MNAIGNNKKVNLILCYVGLFFLVILLIMPPVFRLVFKEKKEEVSFIQKLKEKREKRKFIIK